MILEWTTFLLLLSAATPILLAALGETIVERAGVLNLGVEGMMITGALAGFAAAHATGSPAAGFLGGAGASLLFGLALAVIVGLVIMGGIFVIETLSVMIQVASFKLTGKRVFRMAPFHHHFENGGWAETTVVVRFWIISAMAVALGLALFYGEWLTQDGVSA